MRHDQLVIIENHIYERMLDFERRNLLPKGFSFKVRAEGIAAATRKNAKMKSSNARRKTQRRK